MKSHLIKSLDKPWSAITLGCWQIAPSEGWGDMCSAVDAEATVKCALDCGITAFDTAEGYGDGESERRLGKALGSKKNDVVIISKIWPDAPLNLKGYQERLEGTLKALNRDYVDVYLVHWAGSFFNSPEKSSQLIELMQTLRESGKAKSVGLSNFWVDDLRLLGDDLTQFAVNQIPYSLLEREYESDGLNICQEKVATMAYSPSARGLLAGRLDDEARKTPTRQSYSLYQEPLFSHSKSVLKVVQEISQELDCPAINVALAWVLAQDHVMTAVVGSRKPDQVREFASAGSLTLSPQLLSKLTAASDAFHAAKK